MIQKRNDEHWHQFVISLSTETNRIFRLTSGEEATQREFIRLAYEIYTSPETNKQVHSVHAGFIYFRSTVPGILRRRDAIPDELVQKCLAWQKTYNAFLERNPKVELFYMLKDMSETEMHESWFSDSTMESVILDWVDSDNYEPLPIHRDDLKIVTPAFYERLKLLRQKCGGWLFKAPITRQILFAPDRDIDELRWKRDSSGTYRPPSFWAR